MSDKFYVVYSSEYQTVADAIQNFVKSLYHIDKHNNLGTGNFYAQQEIRILSSIFIDANSSTIIATPYVVLYEKIKTKQYPYQIHSISMKELEQEKLRALNSFSIYLEKKEKCLLFSKELDSLAINPFYFSSLSFTNSKAKRFLCDDFWISLYSLEQCFLIKTFGRVIFRKNNKVQLKTSINIKLNIKYISTLIKKLEYLALDLKYSEQNYLKNKEIFLAHKIIWKEGSLILFEKYYEKFIKKGNLVTYDALFTLKRGITTTMEKTFSLNNLYFQTDNIEDMSEKKVIARLAKEVQLLKKYKIIKTFTAEENSVDLYNSLIYLQNRTKDKDYAKNLKILSLFIK